LNSSSIFKQGYYLFPDNDNEFVICGRNPVKSGSEEVNTGGNEN
jgi:hypothetical protein